MGVIRISNKTSLIKNLMDRDLQANLKKILKLILMMFTNLIIQMMNKIKNKQEISNKMRNKKILANPFIEEIVNINLIYMHLLINEGLKRFMVI